MKSMTGFGRSSNRFSGRFSGSNLVDKSSSSKKQKSARHVSKLKAAVELEFAVKAVNGRYLDIRFHLPREYAGLEGEFKNLLGQIFRRGTLDVYVNRSRSENEAGEVRVNHALAASWLASYRELGRTLKLKSKEPSLELLSRVPEIFAVEHFSDIGENEVDLAKSLLREAAEACNREREREGQALAGDLDRHCARLEAIAEEAENLKERAKAELERRTLNRLQDHLKKLGFDGKVDEQRIAQEIVISLDRVDIAEELQRLREHLRAYRHLLKSSTSEGKKLDFYAQELLREVNTIGSKSHIASLTSLVVEAKTLVERIREQVQNVE
jgi:uncharacterized protein (TIGR00255 family)